MRELLKKCLVEFIGAFFLIFTIGCSCFPNGRGAFAGPCAGCDRPAGALHGSALSPAGSSAEAAVKTAESIGRRPTVHSAAAEERQRAPLAAAARRTARCGIS